MLIRSGHESVIEHGHMSVKFISSSRGLTHELVRHRIASFSQESTRYVDYAKKGKGVDLDRFEITFITPPNRNEHELITLENGSSISPIEMLETYESYYRALRKAGWTPEDARQFLPIATKAEIVVSANFREWRHIFAMRTQKAAHWEIRRVMCKLLETVQEIVPTVFDDFVLDGSCKKEVPYYKKISV